MYVAEPVGAAARWRIGPRCGPTWTSSAYAAADAKGGGQTVSSLGCRTATKPRPIGQRASWRPDNSNRRKEDNETNPCDRGLGRDRARSCGLQQQQQQQQSSAGASSSSSSGGTVDIYSSLPLQGASTAQTDPMVNGIKLALAAGTRQGRAVHGQLPVARRLDRGGRQVGPRPDGRQRAQGGCRPEGRLLHRRVQLGRQRGVDPDPQPGGHPAGQPGEHLRRPDDEPAWQRPRRAAEVLPDRRRAPTCGSCRSTRSRPPRT